MAPDLQGAWDQRGSRPSALGPNLDGHGRYARPVLWGGGGHSGGFRFELEGIDASNPLANPPHHRHGHAVAQHLVARPVSHHALAVWNQREVVGEALEPFALARGETADGGTGDYFIVAARSIVGIQGGVGFAFPHPGLTGLEADNEVTALITANRPASHDRLGDVRFPRLAILAAIHGHNGESDGWSMRAARQRVARIAWLRIAEISGAGDLGRIERDCVRNVHAPVAVGAATIQGRAKMLARAEVLPVERYDQSVGFFGSIWSAALSSACLKGAGNALPLFSARRRMPRQAVALKKNRGGTSPVSKISDNEHATAALWNSEVLSVENAVGEPIPEFCHPSEDGSKVPSSVRRQDTGDVLPYQPSGPCAISKAEIFEGQVATVVSQSASKAGDAERLAGGASDKKVNWSIFGAFDFGEVAAEGDVGIMMSEHSAGRGFDLGIAKRLPAKWLPCGGRGADARADVDVAHLSPHRSRQPGGGGEEGRHAAARWRRGLAFRSSIASNASTKRMSGLSAVSLRETDACVIPSI